MSTATYPAERRTGWWSTFMAGLLGAGSPASDFSLVARGGTLPSVAGADRLFLVVVDGSDEMRSALHYACRRAAATAAGVALVRLLDPVEFRYFAAAQERIRTEAVGEAEALLLRLGDEVERLSGRPPALFVREGEPCRELIRLMAEQPGIATLVMASPADSRPANPLIAAFSGRYCKHLPVPLTIVPSHLSPAQADACM